MMTTYANLGRRIVDVIPVPIIAGVNVTGIVVRIGIEREEPSSPLRVSCVHGRHVQILHTSSFKQKLIQLIILIL
jgi:hypothetical protein